MFDLGRLFKRADTVQRHLAAPLARSRLAYLGHRAEEGAKPSTLRGIAALQVNLVRYLELGEDGSVAPTEVEAAAKRWVSQDPARRGGDAEGIRQRFVSQATCWLRFAGRLQVAAAPSHPHSAEVAVFVDYMRRERGWSEATIRYRRSRADEFLCGFCRGNRTLADITIEAVDCAPSDREARDGRVRTRATIRNRADALRAFFRFAEDRGWCQPGLAAAITSPRVYKDATLPAGPSAEDLERLLATTEGDQPEDLRDRALLLTLSVYGLRAGEARGLRLDDINWDAETLRIHRPKTGRTDLFPLSRRVGDAIARYLREARPRTDPRREVFLSSRAPSGPLSLSKISSIVRSRMQRCGIDCPRRGAHALRHAFAQRLLEEGFSMQEIGDCLGHRSPASTAIYAKVDLARLRQVADFDLEGLT